MLKYTVKQLLTAVLQIFLVATIVFLLIRTMPGDPAVLALGTERGNDPAAVELMREQLGLNQPLIRQYVSWLKQLVTLDFGTSLFNNVEVMTYITTSLPKTLELALISIIFASATGILFGVLGAVFRGRIWDSIISVFTSIGISLPVYVMGTFLILLFSFHFNLLPASGYVAYAEDPGEHIRRIILPAITVGLPVSSAIARMTRSSMLEVMNKNFVVTLKAKGLSEKAIMLKHVLRNSIISVITVIGLQLGNLIGGTVLIEALFNWPGLSTQLITAVNNRNYPLIQVCVVVIAGIYIIINRIIDILYGVMDPRTR